MPVRNRNLASVLFFALSVLATFKFRVAAQEEVPMPPPQTILNLIFENTEWNLTWQGKYLLVKDPRSLYKIYHPWGIPEDGDFAVTSTQVIIPENRRNPIYLNLYANKFTSQRVGSKPSRAGHISTQSTIISRIMAQAGQVRHLRAVSKSDVGRTETYIRNTTSDSH